MTPSLVTIVESQQPQGEFHTSVGGWVFDEDQARRGVQCPWHLRMRSSLQEPDSEPGFAYCRLKPGHDGDHQHDMNRPAQTCALSISINVFFDSRSMP